MFVTKRPQDGLRAAQDAFRRRLGGVLEPGAAQEAPRPPPGLDSRPPDLDFGASRPEFWKDFTYDFGMSYEIENQNRYRYKVNYINKYFMVAAGITLLFILATSQSYYN